MKNINFEPWIGDKYLSHGYNGKRILVLGESHYCEKELTQGGRCFPLCKKENMKADCFSQTNDFIISYLEDYTGHGPQQTYVCFERAVLGKELTIEERKLFWNSIIFYNYIQFSQKGPRQNIKEEQSNVSEKAFKELLEKYKPDYIIIWGARLYDRLPYWGGKHSVLSVGRDSTDIWTYSIKGKSIPAMKVLHPSTPVGKSWPYWHKFYQKFLGM